MMTRARSKGAGTFAGDQLNSELKNRRRYWWKMSPHRDDVRDLHSPTDTKAWQTQHARCSDVQYSTCVDLRFNEVPEALLAEEVLAKGAQRQRSPARQFTCRKAFREQKIFARTHIETSLAILAHGQTQCHMHSKHKRHRYSDAQHSTCVDL